MNVTHFMHMHYGDLLLTPALFHEVKHRLHVDLGDETYQLNDDGTLNMYRFQSAYTHVAQLFSQLFQQDDEVLIVMNSYPIDRTKTTYPNVFRRYVNAQHKRYTLRTHSFYWALDDDDVYVQQMTLACRVAELKWQPLLQALIHKDFRKLQPQLRCKHNAYAPSVFFINVRTTCIFHVYDDRGCEIMSANATLLDQIKPYTRYAQ